MANPFGRHKLRGMLKERLEHLWICPDQNAQMKIFTNQTVILVEIMLIPGCCVIFPLPESKFRRWVAAVPDGVQR